MSASEVHCRVSHIVKPSFTPSRCERSFGQIPSRRVFRPVSRNRVGTYADFSQLAALGIAPETSPNLCVTCRGVVLWNTRKSQEPNFSSLGSDLAPGRSGVGCGVEPTAMRPSVQSEPLLIAASN